jgi:uncharacterized protein (TIGR03118 family)
MRFEQNHSRVLLAGFIVVLTIETCWAGVTVTNLVTDDQSVNAALITDTNLKNPWGVAYSPSSPFWVADNRTGLATLYSVDPITNLPTTQGLVVTIPGDGSVTGQAFNNTSDFNGNSFLFVSEDGTVSGWRNALGTNAEILVTPSSNNVYKGATVATIGANTYLYAANFRAGAIDVFKGNNAAPDLAGNFTDPNIPSGFAPFNIQHLGDKLYVTYALQDASKTDDVPGLGNGFVDSFDLNGSLLGRIASAGPLNSPWGLVIAPTGFEGVGGDLLIGNFGNGLINAFNPVTLNNDGPIKVLNGNPVSIDELWALVPGNDGQGGNSNRIYFSAGSNEEMNGLFGSLTSIPEPSTLMLIFIGSAALTGWQPWRRMG